MLNGGLRQATLRQVSDSRLRQGLRVQPPRHRRALQRRPHALRRSTPDGKQPLSSGCFGDSGGPLVVGTNAAPVQLGVVSWGGDKCGADHSPSRVRRRRPLPRLHPRPDPTWGPDAAHDGEAHRHQDAHLPAAQREPGTQLSYAVEAPAGTRQLVTVATGRRYKPTKSRRGTGWSASPAPRTTAGEILAGSADRPRCRLVAGCARQPPVAALAGSDSWWNLDVPLGLITAVNRHPVHMLAHE